MMLEYLILILLLRYRNMVSPRAANDEHHEDNALKPYAGIYYEGEQEYLRRVK